MREGRTQKKEKKRKGRGSNRRLYVLVFSKRT